MSICVLTHLIGQNGRAMCKKHGGHGDAFDVARHIVPCAWEPAGPAMVTKREPAGPATVTVVSNIYTC